MVKIKWSIGFEWVVTGMAVLGVLGLLYLGSDSPKSMQIAAPSSEDQGGSSR